MPAGLEQGSPLAVEPLHRCLWLPAGRGPALSCFAAAFAAELAAGLPFAATSRRWAGAPWLCCQQYPVAPAGLEQGLPLAVRALHWTLASLILSRAHTTLQVPE